MFRTSNIVSQQAPLDKLHPSKSTSVVRKSSLPLHQVALHYIALYLNIGRIFPSLAASKSQFLITG